MKKIFTLFAVIAVALAHTANSQEISFTGAQSFGSYVRLDSVKVQNVSRSWSETLIYPDTVLTFTQTAINDEQSIAADVSAYPNPFNGTTNVALTMPRSGNATLQIFTLTGQKVAERTIYLEAGSSLFEMRLQKKQVYLLTVTTSQGRRAIKLINKSVGNENVILSRGTIAVVEKRETTQFFQSGDVLKIVGYASYPGLLSESREIIQAQIESEDFILIFDKISEDGLLPATFSVSANTEVRFSKGNLQYTTTGVHEVAGGDTVPGTWRFAPNQWDTIGTGNDNFSPSDTGWIDLFGWGTSGYHNPSDPYNTNYQPYSTYITTTVVDSFLNYYGYGPSVNMIDTNLTGTSANYDWGIYNAISNGGNRPGLWRTLTQKEWSYLLETRNTTSGVRYAKATVTGVQGLIIVPDNWSTATYHLDSVNTPTISFTANFITAAQWVTILEKAGCVFLPAAGFRASNSVSWANRAGVYWASTCTNCSVSNNISFQRNICSFTTYQGNARYYGHSVRLVTK